MGKTGGNDSTTKGTNSRKGSNKKKGSKKVTIKDLSNKIKAIASKDKPEYKTLTVVGTAYQTGIKNVGGATRGPALICLNSVIQRGEQPNNFIGKKYKLRNLTLSMAIYKPDNNTNGADIQPYSIVSTGESDVSQNVVFDPSKESSRTQNRIIMFYVKDCQGLSTLDPSFLFDTGPYGGDYYPTLMFNSANINWDNVKILYDEKYMDDFYQNSGSHMKWFHIKLHGMTVEVQTESGTISESDIIRGRLYLLHMADSQYGTYNVNYQYNISFTDN